MSHRPGTPLGVVHSVEALRLRCFCDDVTGCWHWRLHIDDQGPRVRLVKNGKPENMRGRRAALFLARGRDLPQGHVAYAAEECKSHDCVNPAHALSAPKAVWGREMARRGLMSSPAKAVAGRKSGIPRRKLTPEQVDEIRRSSEPYSRLAAAFGVGTTTIKDVVKGRRYPPGPACGASAFSWRPGA